MPASCVVKPRDAGWSQRWVAEALEVAVAAVSRRLQAFAGTRAKTVRVLAGPVPRTAAYASS